MSGEPVRPESTECADRSSRAGLHPRQHDGQVACAGARDPPSARRRRVRALGADRGDNRAARGGAAVLGLRLAGRAGARALPARLPFRLSQAGVCSTSRRGPGSVAIAAAKAEASTVVACDLDALAVCAVGLNAALNCVDITARQADVAGRRPERRRGRAGGRRVLRAGAGGGGSADAPAGSDGGRAGAGRRSRPWLHAALRLFDALATYQVPGALTQEDGDVKPSTVWRLRDPAAR